MFFPNGQVDVRWRGNKHFALEITPKKKVTSQIRRSRITPPPDIATLRQRIIDECDALRHQAPMIRRAVREMEKRANLCVERNGGHVEGHGM